MKKKQITKKELTEALKRVQAEFENYKKRTEKQQDEFKDYIVAETISKFLPILDTFELALQNDKDSKGLDLVYVQLLDLLEKEGLKKINSIGKPFNPFYHEVLLKEYSKEKEEIITEEIQSGYVFKNKLLRHSKVKISRGKK